MNLLQQIRRGKSNMPPRIMTYGTEGIGKSTLAARTPNPIFVQTEDGLGQIDCDKFPLAITVKCKKREDTGETVNELKGYASRESLGGQPQQMPTDTPPWRRLRLVVARPR